MKFCKRKNTYLQYFYCQLKKKMKMKKIPKKTKSILEKINKGNAHENGSSSALENNDNTKNQNQGETGKAIQMNEHSNKDINTEKK